MSTVGASVPRALDAPERIVAVDIARLVAVVGMMVAHMVTASTEFPASIVTGLTTGFPSTLFAVVAGVGSALAADAVRRDSARSAPWTAEAAQLSRGFVVALVGVLLAPVPTGIAVVLVPLGVSLMIVAPLVRAPASAVGALIVVLAVAGPLVIIAAAGSLLPGTPTTAQRLDHLLFSGVYPVITWVVYVTVGLLIGRALLAALRRGRALVFGAQLALAGLGALIVATVVDALYVSLVAVPARIAEVIGAGSAEEIAAQLRGNGFGAPYGGGWDAILIAAPHTGTTLDILRTAGGAALVLGVLLVVLRGPAPRDGIVRSLAAAGGAALTIYVVHVLSTWPLGSIRWPEPSLAWGVGLLANLIFVGVLGYALARTGCRGPLEYVVRRAGRAGARAAATAHRHVDSAQPGSPR